MTKDYQSYCDFYIRYCATWTQITMPRSQYDTFDIGAEWENTARISCNSTRQYIVYASGECGSGAV